MSKLTWFRSTYSDNTGGDCVETALTWHKSTHSDSGGGDCVEVAAATCVYVRDSKDTTHPPLHLSPTAWNTFLDTLR